MINIKLLIGKLWQNIPSFNLELNPNLRKQWKDGKLTEELFIGDKMLQNKAWDDITPRKIRQLDLLDWKFDFLVWWLVEWMPRKA